MSVYHGVDGQVLSVEQKFLDDDGQPLIPAAGYPRVRLLDKAGDMLVTVTAAAVAGTPGAWSANMPVPRMELTERTEFKLQWRFKSQDDERIKVSDVALIEPSFSARASDIVTIHGATTVQFSIPIVVDPSWTADWQVWYNNDSCIRNPVPNLMSLIKHINLDSTTFEIPISDIPYASLTAYLLMMTFNIPGSQPRSFSYKIYSVTPQIMLGVSHLEDFLNKSRVEQVIPELRWTTGDLLVYLERGLYLFNQVGYPTGFNGTNMRGILFNAWLTCSTLYAISAQLLAEGSLAFNFNGQGISLDVDRTPQLDAALGRIESQIQQDVVPLKKVLNTQGITQGDGSVGDTKLNNPLAGARLGVINAVTTRMPGWSTIAIGRRR